jgi:hypothetical protein
MASEWVTPDLITFKKDTMHLFDKHKGILGNYDYAQLLAQTEEKMV